MNKLWIMIRLKSKTVNVMAFYTAIIALLEALGVSMDPKVVAAIGTIVAMIMRAITDSPLEDKVLPRAPTMK